MLHKILESNSRFHTDKDSKLRKLTCVHAHQPTTDTSRTVHVPDHCSNSPQPGSGSRPGVGTPALPHYRLAGNAKIQSKQTSVARSDDK